MGIMTSKTKKWFYKQDLYGNYKFYQKYETPMYHGYSSKKAAIKSLLSSIAMEIEDLYNEAEEAKLSAQELERTKDNLSRRLKKVK